MSNSKFSHTLPGEHEYEGILFFEYSPPEILDQVKQFQIKDDDIFLITYPKAGTTWLQEVAWLIANQDFDKVNQSQVYFRSPFLEFKDTTLNEIGLEIAANIPSPRVIKSHLMPQLMPIQMWDKSCKMVLLFRNPKDLCVSYYHFYRSSSSLGNYKGSWEEFFQMFVEGHTEHGSWFDFTQLWWEKSQSCDRIKIIFYEDMKKNLDGEVNQLAQFLGYEITDEVAKKIADHCTFDKMKNNPMTNHHDVYSIKRDISPLLRKGTVGDWKNTFTVAQNEEFDKIYKGKLGGYNIPFVYE